MNSTNTGRLSSISPNLQNIPIRTEEGSKLRNAFTAKDSHSVISADYSQIELRILAHIADVKAFKEAFTRGLDIHKLTAASVFDINVDQVTSEERRLAKAINFGIIYGLQAFGLASRLHISVAEAQRHIDNYFIIYPEIKRYMNQAILDAKEQEFVTTMLNRKCAIPSINSTNRNIVSLSERAAINAPIQGTSADIIKKAMVSFDSKIREAMVCQIHDELLFEVPTELCEEYAKKIKTVMENVIQLSVPLEVNISYGKSWGEIK